MPSRLPEAQRTAIEKAVDWQGQPAATPVSSGGGGADGDESTPAPPSRMDYVQSLIRQEDANVLRRLVDEKQVQLEAFIFDGDSTSKLRKLPLSADSEGRLDPKFLAGKLTTTGKVTALGSVVHEVHQQFGAGRLGRE